MENLVFIDLFAGAGGVTDGAMSRFALQKCSNLVQMLSANLLIARVIRWHGKFSRNLN